VVGRISKKIKEKFGAFVEQAGGECGGSVFGEDLLLFLGEDFAIVNTSFGKCEESDTG